jgi:hypothetical protein
MERKTEMLAWVEASAFNCEEAFLRGEYGYGEHNNYQRECDDHASRVRAARDANITERAIRHAELTGRIRAAIEEMSEADERRYRRRLHNLGRNQ